MRDRYDYPSWKGNRRVRVTADNFVFRVPHDADVWTKHAGNRVHRALQAAQKYSLAANSVKSEIVVEPTIEMER
jgi:hypothetical protein